MGWCGPYGKQTSELSWENTVIGVV
jgi:hypothetical protein